LKKIEKFCKKTRLISLLGLFNFTLGVIFIIIALVFLKVARRNFLNKEAEGAWSGLLATITCLVIGIYLASWGIYGLANLDHLKEIAPQLPIPYPLGFYTLAFLPIIILYIGLYALREQKREKAGVVSESKTSRKIHPLDLEVSRKAFHITIIGILVCYLFVGKLAADALFPYLANNWDIWGIDFNLVQNVFGEYLIVPGKAFAIFMIIAIFFLLALTDIVRIFAPKYYPVKLVGDIYREREKNSLGPHIHLAIGVLFAVIFFSPPIAMAVIAMAALGDAAATIVGINLGKHKINAKSKKTWEGCIGGVAVSFGSGFLCMIALVKPLDITTISASLILCAVGAFIFFLTDYFTPTIPLTDNILNPICIGLVMTGFAWLFFPSVL
jgi:dolichol kinase